MQTIQAHTSACSSAEYAAVLLDAWDRGDISVVNRQLVAPPSVRVNSSSLEGERLELLVGITETFRSALDRGAAVGTEVSASIELLRHLAKMKD